MIDPGATKICTNCNRELPVTHYSKRNSHSLQSACKDCKNTYNKAHYGKYKDYYKKKAKKRNAVGREVKRLIIQAAKKQPCADCGIEYPYYVMDFDHRDPSTKEFNIGDSSAIRISESILKTEILKCDVVCANCHRGRTQRGVAQR